MVDENINEALIMEDDVDFDESLLEVLNEKVKIKVNWDLILLGHHGGASREIDTVPSFWEQRYLWNNYKLVRPSEIGYGAYGFLITKQGAQKLLNNLEIITKPIDHFTGDSHYLNLYTVNPALINISKYLSDNFNSMEDRLELDKERIALIQNQPVKTVKKIVKNLGLYSFVNSLRVKLNIFMGRLKPLKKYQ